MNPFLEYQQKYPLLNILKKIMNYQIWKAAIHQVLTDHNQNERNQKLECKILKFFLSNYYKQINTYFKCKSSKQQLKIAKAIAEFQSSNKQSTIKPFRTNTDNDSSNYSDDERGKPKFKRAKKQLNLLITKQIIMKITKIKIY